MNDPFFDLDDPTPRPVAPAAALPVREPDWLLALNPQQREAVEAVDGPVLVLAGAGTGKTKVLTARLAYVLATRRAWPSQILSVTFTNKAAREMRERVAALLGQPADDLWLGTFHSICARILRRHAELVGLRPDFTILDADDQLRLVKQLLQAAEIDDRKWPARGLLAIIQRWKDRGLAPKRVPAGEESGFAGGRALEFYGQYQERLRTLNAADFGDLLLHCLTLLQENKDVLKSWQERFKYILVDEYQDTNLAQYLWLRLLAQGRHNICCVGDDDQSIYSWRGAEIENILKFERDFPNAKVVRLERNYRSTSNILAAASGLIAHNAGRLGKTLWTEGESGDKVLIRGVWDGAAEARAVCEEIEALRANGQGYDGMAILVRAGFQTREFEDRLIILGIPYRVLGGPRFYERAEIRDALAYLRVVNQPSDGLAFERIVNQPKRGLGEATVQTLHMLARAQNIPLMEAGRRIVETDELKPKARNTLRALINDFDRWRSLVPIETAPDLARIVLDESGYTAMWQADRSPEAPGRLENLKEFVTVLADYDNLTAFLEHVALVLDNDEKGGGERVSLMTLHGAKGLEFDVVFLPGWEEGLFPHQRAIDETGQAGLEEERRLAYVGLTRARRRAIITFAANRRIYNNWQNALPSRFIDELPPAHCEVFAEAGLYGSNSGLEEPASAFAWSRADRRAKVINGQGYETTPRAPSAGGFTIGDRVFHQKFGGGRVTGVDGNKLEITFDKAGAKKVMDSFVSKA